MCAAKVDAPVRTEQFANELARQRVETPKEVAAQIAKLDGDGSSVSDADLEKLTKLAQKGAFISVTVDDKGDPHQVSAGQALNPARKAKVDALKRAKEIDALAKEDPDSAIMDLIASKGLIANVSKDTLITLATWAAKNDASGVGMGLATILCASLAASPVASPDGTATTLVDALLLLPMSSAMFSLGNGSKEETFKVLSDQDFRRLMNAVLAANWQTTDKAAALRAMVRKCGERIKNDAELGPKFESVIRDEVSKAHVAKREGTEANLVAMYQAIYGQSLVVRDP